MRTLRSGLRGRVVLALLAALVPLIALEAYLLDTQAAMLRERIVSERGVLARSLAGEAGSLVAGRFSTLLAMAKTAEVRDPEAGRLNDLIRAVTRDDPSWIVLGLSDHEGWNISSLTTPPHGVNVADRDYFQGALMGEPTVGAAILARSTGQKTLVLAVPVDALDGRRLVLSGALSLGDLERHLRLSLPAGVTAIVADRRGQQFIGPGIGGSFPAAADRPGVQPALAGRSGALVTDGGSGQLVAYASVPSAGWAVVIEEPAAGAFTEIDRQRGVALGLSGAATLIGLMVAAYLGGRLEQTFARDRDRLERILDEMPVAVAIYDREGRVTLRNAFYRSQFGGGAAPLTLREVARHYHTRTPEGRPLDETTLATGRALRGEEVRGERFVFDNPVTGEPVEAMVSAFPVRSGGKVEAALGVFQDITELTRVDRQRTAFFDMASHEIKTPLTALLGHVQIARRLALQQRWDRMTESLARAEQGAQRLAELVRDLLDVSRLDAARLELSRQRVDLNGLVAEVVEDVRAGVEKHEVALEPEDVPLVVDADRLRVAQILQNLLDNAVRYSPGGGRIMVRVRRQGEEAVVSVSDQGIGVPDEERQRLFERFFRTSRAAPYGGTGLGLFISRRMAEMHGGRLWLDQTGENGSTFVLALPLARAARVESAPETAESMVERL